MPGRRRERCRSPKVGDGRLQKAAPEASLVVRCRPQRGITLKVEYLGEIEVIFETALDNETGDQDGSIHEKA